MSAPRPVLTNKPGGRGKVQDVTKQADRHTQLASLALKAVQAPDSLERMLAVCRLLLCWLTDVMRPGTGFQDTPVLTLGHHHLSHRDLAERHRGDPTRLYLQEAVTYEPGYKPTRHGKYDAGNVTLARLQYSFVPTCSAKVQRTGVLGAQVAYAECSLEGTGELVFERHAERYVFALPSLVFSDPLAEECPLDLDGLLEVRCPATGLGAELRFKPFRQQYIKGYITRLAGDGAARIAAVRGSWAGTVDVVGMESAGEGVLFDAAQYGPPMSASIDLAEPGPRAMPCLWSAILQGLTLMDPAQAAPLGKKAEQLVQALSTHLRKALGYAVEEAPGPGVPAAAAPASATAEEGEGSSGSSAAAAAMPPCIAARVAAGTRPHYFLLHLLQALPQD